MHAISFGETGSVSNELWQGHFFARPHGAMKCAKRLNAALEKFPICSISRPMAPIGATRRRAFVRRRAEHWMSEMRHAPVEECRNSARPRVGGVRGRALARHLHRRCPVLHAGCPRMPTEAHVDISRGWRGRLPDVDTAVHARVDGCLRMLTKVDIPHPSPVDAPAPRSARRVLPPHGRKASRCERGIGRFFGALV